jgi:hypothetical protein
MKRSLASRSSLGHSARCTSSVWSESSQEYSAALSIETWLKVIWCAPLPAMVFVVDAAAAQVALGQARQAVRLVHFEHVALQHGVVHVARTSMPWLANTWRSYLTCWPSLCLLAVLQPGLEARSTSSRGSWSGAPW